MTKLIVGLVFLVASVSFGQASPPQAAIEKDKEAIKASLVAMWDALEHGDVQRYATYLHPDFSAFYENDEYLNEGKDLEVRVYADYLKYAKNIHTEMHNPKVTVRGDTAWITYYWNDWGEVDGKRVSSRGKSSRIFVKENGKWLCIFGHYTTAP